MILSFAHSGFGSTTAYLWGVGWDRLKKDFRFSFWATLVAFTQNNGCKDEEIQVDLCRKLWNNQCSKLLCSCIWQTWEHLILQPPTVRNQCSYVSQRSHSLGTWNRPKQYNYNPPWASTSLLPFVCLKSNGNCLCLIAQECPKRTIGNFPKG